MMAIQGLNHLQLDNVVKMQKSWNYDNDDCKVEAIFGKMRNGRQTPVVVMNVYENGVSVSLVVDDNCDVWESMFATPSKEEGNEYFRYLKKHGFCKVEA